ncbi:MAG TPA: ABC transporter permease subunit [Chitinophagaceae bacterium]|nr:ABC transporter permease subunit [Chitinophagaceae bacterium]
MKPIFSFELKKCLKSKTVWLTFILWCIIIAFATQQRIHTINVLRTANDTSAQYELRKAAAYFTLLDSAETGKKQFPKYDSDPRNPVYFNNSLPRFAIFPPGPLNSFATGQSDVMPSLYVISRRYDYRVQKEEAVNGLQLLYGKIDIAFVIVFLLPLVIIAFNYNILSSEKENGTLKLLMVQGSSLQQIVWAKMLVSLLFTLLLLLLPVACIVVEGIDPSRIISALGIYLLVALLYSLFWHLLCAFINRKIKSSAYNATILLSSWLFIVLVLPTLINTITEIVHPVPSRTKFITDYRHTLNEMERDSNSVILDKYFFDHPELVKQDTTGNTRNRANEFYKAIHINQDKTQTALQPLYVAHDNALRSANDFANKAGLISPAICMQQSLLLLAGQSSRQYVYFIERIDEWRKPYLKFIFNKLLLDKDVSKTEALQLKPFSYPPYDYSGKITLNIFLLLLFNIFLIIIVAVSLKGTIIT